MFYVYTSSCVAFFPQINMLIIIIIIIVVIIIIIIIIIIFFYICVKYQPYLKKIFFFYLKNKTFHIAWLL